MSTAQDGNGSLGIPSEEFAARRAAVAARCAERGLAGLIVFSRGGTSADFYGDVMYLSNFHSTFCVVPDSPKWAARGHAAVILPVDGPCVLVTDYLDDPDDRVRIKDVRVSPQLPQAIGEVVRELGLVGRPLGLVGRESLTLEWFKQIEQAAGPGLKVTPADDILERQRLIKSAAELDLMRAAAAVGVGWMNTMMEALDPGRTEGDAVGEGLRYLAAHGGTQYDIAIASGPNSEHYWGSSGIPHWNSTRPLEHGDLVHVDVWGPINGYYTDFARSTVIGRRPNGAQRDVLEASVALVEHVTAGARPGATFGDLYRRGEAWLGDNDFTGPDAIQGLGLFGHSLGLTPEARWIVAEETTVLEPNMVIAIETFIGRKGIGASNFENNLVIGADGTEILTAACDDRWWD